MFCISHVCFLFAACSLFYNGLFLLCWYHMLSNLKTIIFCLLLFKCLMHLEFTLWFILVLFHALGFTSNRVIPSFVTTLMNEGQYGSLWALLCFCPVVVYICYVNTPFPLSSPFKQVKPHWPTWCRCVSRLLQSSAAEDLAGPGTAYSGLSAPCPSSRPHASASVSRLLLSSPPLGASLEQGTKQESVLSKTLADSSSSEGKSTNECEETASHLIPQAISR